MNFPLIANIVVFVVLLFALAQIRHKQWSLAKKVLVGLVMGVVFGLALHTIYGSDSQVLKDSVQWFNIVGNGYVQLLQMIVMPLVFASILSAVARLHNASQLGKISFLTIGTLLFTTLIAALVGVLVTNLFGLTAEGLVQGGAETARLNAIESNYVGKVSDLSVPQQVLSFIPKNPFADLTGANPTSIISVVIFAAFLGVAALKLLKDDAPKGERVLTAIDTLQSWVMKLVRLVMQLTPYGVLALMTKVVAGSNLQDIIKLGSFVVASYLGLLIMFAVHGLLLGINGVSPLKYFRKVWPVLTFAFTSRSSAASIPLNVEAQTRRLGVPESIASFAASFGATIGQNIPIHKSVVLVGRISMKFRLTARPALTIISSVTACIVWGSTLTRRITNRTRSTITGRAKHRRGRNAAVLNHTRNAWKAIKFASAVHRLANIIPIRVCSG